MKVAQSSRKAHNLVKRRLFHAREYWRTDNERYGRLLAEALLLQHYNRDYELTRDSRRVRPKTLRQFNLLRHKASLLLRSGPDFDTHPLQATADSGAAEVSGRIIRSTFNDPLKGYHRYRSGMVWSMLAAERGNIAIEWHPRWGVCFRLVDPRRFHLTPGFTFLHDPRNPAILEELPMRRSEVMAMKSAGWDVPSDLTGDGGMKDFGEGGSREADGIERDQSPRLPGADENDSDDPIVTICKAWFRDDPFAQDNKRFANAELPTDEWYFLDDATQQQVPFDPNNPVPPVSPINGQPMRLITSKTQAYSGGNYGDGYLIITAPWYAGERPFFEGKWMDGALNPEVTPSAFPYMELGTYCHPLKRCGISDTELTHSIRVISNSSIDSTWQQMRTTGGILITKEGSLKDSEGNQFQFTNQPLSIGYTDDMLSQEQVKFFQAPGMNQAAVAFQGMIDGMWQDIGTGDFSASLGPDRSKDIATGTLNMLQQSGDLPVQLHQQDLNLQEAIAGRVVLDLCRAYMGDQAITWVTDAGEVATANVRGADLIPMNVSITASKEWRQQDVDRVQATAQLLAMISKLGLPPQAMAPLLREAGISASTASAVTDAMQQQSGPPENPAALITALASLIKSGGQVAINQVEAALQMASLPPPQGEISQPAASPGASGLPDMSAAQGATPGGM